MCLGCGSNPCLAAVADTASQYVGLTTYARPKYLEACIVHTALVVINQNIGFAQVVIKLQNRGQNGRIMPPFNAEFIPLPVTGYFLGFFNVFVVVNPFHAPCAFYVQGFP